MGGIQQCVKDVLSMANETQCVKDVLATDPSKFDQAKKRIEQLFAESKGQHRGHLAVAQRVRDQLDQVYNDAPADSQLCLDQLFDWLDRGNLGPRPAPTHRAPISKQASDSAAVR
jgi:hypothetical protein